MLLLSIITPMYNVEKYLSKFLDSLISAYNGDFEILLIDDGSTDSSLEIASEYSSVFPFIRIEHQKNSGPAVARNRGISHTSGQYIAFMDSDDYILPERFCSIIEEVKHHEAEMWISDFYRVADNGFVLDKVFQIKETTEPILDRAYMRVNEAENTAWSTPEDSRKTAFGSFIRKCSMDELPQLFNVLKGDMSLVGPRPELPFFVRRFKEDVPLYLVRQQVRPGMTGWAQVHGLRGDTSIEARVEYDIWYIENWSIMLDIKILLMTLFKGCFINDEKLTGRENMHSAKD